MYEVFNLFYGNSCKFIVNCLNGNFGGGYLSFNLKNDLNRTSNSLININTDILADGVNKVTFSLGSSKTSLLSHGKIYPFEITFVKGDSVITLFIGFLNIDNRVSNVIGIDNTESILGKEIYVIFDFNKLCSRVFGKGFIDCVKDLSDVIDGVIDGGVWE